MRQTEPTEETKAEIIENMEKTFFFRNNWIKRQRPSAEEILEDYPRFLDFNGKLVSIIKMLSVLTSVIP